jgi:hypothetical protein
MEDIKKETNEEKIPTKEEFNIYIDPTTKKEYYMKLFPKSHPGQIPIPEIGNHKFTELVWDPKLESLIFRGKLMKWKVSKTNLKKKGVDSKVQYAYNTVYLIDTNKKIVKVFQRKFERILRERYLKKRTILHDDDDDNDDEKKDEEEEKKDDVDINDDDEEKDSKIELINEEKEENDVIEIVPESKHEKKKQLHLTLLFPHKQKREMPSPKWFHQTMTKEEEDADDEVGRPSWWCRPLDMFFPRCITRENIREMSNNYTRIPPEYEYFDICKTLHYFEGESLIPQILEVMENEFFPERLDLWRHSEEAYDFLM